VLAVPIDFFVSFPYLHQHFIKTVKKGSHLVIAFLYYLCGVILSMSDYFIFSCEVQYWSRNYFLKLLC